MAGFRGGVLNLVAIECEAMGVARVFKNERTMPPTFLRSDRRHRLPQTKETP